MSLRIALLANLKLNAPVQDDSPADRWAELDSPATVEAISSAFREAGHDAVFLEGDESLCSTLPGGRFDIAFNICEGRRGDAREAQVPALLEMLGIPYTGSKVLCLALTLDKAMTKRILRSHGLPTPAFQVFEHPSDPLDPGLAFPLFVKPVGEGTGMGITSGSLVENERALRERVEAVLGEYEQPALVERYVEGREVTVGLVGNETPRIFPPLEIRFDRCPPEERGIYTSRLKAELYDLPDYVCPAPLENRQVEELKELALRTFRAVGCLDFARVDFRLDASKGERPYILEINPLPGLCPGVSDLVMQAEAVGMSHAELIMAIVSAALSRYPDLAPRAEG